jgi:hypothetical protein
MDVSDLRKQILRALDEAQKMAAAKRRTIDDAVTAYNTFLAQLAGPLFVQAANVLRAAGHEFTAHTPAGSVKLAADRSGAEFLELELDSSGLRPQVIGRTSFSRGRHGQVVEERPIAPNKSIADLTDEDVSAFLVAELSKLVTKQ